MCASHLSHEKSTDQASANETFTSKRSIQQSIGQKLSNSQELPRTQPQQHADRFGRKTFIKTCDLSTNLLLLRQDSQFTGQKHEQTVKSSIYRLKLVQTAENFNSPNKNSNERGKTSTHRTKRKQAAKNLNSPNKSLNEWCRTSNYRSKPRTNGKNAATPNENSNNRWKTPKMVAPAYNHTKISETSRTHAVDGNRFYTYPRWAPDDPAG